MSDYDKGYDFSGNRTYRWIAVTQEDSSDALAANPLLRKRVQSAVNRELASRGFVLVAVPGRATLALAARAFVSPKKSLRYTPDPFWPGAFRRGLYFRNIFRPDPFLVYPEYYTYDEAVIVIDMLDERSRETVWKGSAKGTLKQYRTGDAMQKDIDLAVSKIFSDFPLFKAGQR